MLKTFKTITISTVASIVAAGAATTDYKVKKNDTLSEIAESHQVSLSELRTANGIKTGEILKTGEVIKIPSQKEQNRSATYRVKKNDTLSEIAEKHGIGLTKLKAANGMNGNYIIKVGETLKIPTKDGILYPKARSYKVNRYDTLSGIAKMHGVKLSDLRNFNGMDRGEILRVGKIIKIPRGTSSIPRTSTFDPVAKESGSFRSIFKTSKNIKVSNSSVLAKCEKVESIAKAKLGKRYVWGATGYGNTYDCSSFTQHVYRKMGIEIPRTSKVQSKFGKYVKRDELRKGDLIFFDTSKKKKGYVNHVGIYLGDDKFIHASSAKNKVVISKLKNNFYSARYKNARRLLNNPS